MKLAVSGKGGVGKTTVAALLARSFAKEGLKVIAIDADPDANLAGALGIPDDQPVVPLVEMKALIKERVGAGPGEATVYFKMNPKVDDIPDTFSIEKDHIKLMVMGTIRRGGSGCACPENVMIRQLLSHVLVQRDEVVIMDMEAGIEHLGRGTAQFVDAMIVVVEPSVPGIQTFSRIKRLANDLHIQRIIPIGNKIRNETDRLRIEKEIGEKLWCVIPFSDSLSDYNKNSYEEPIYSALRVLTVRLHKELNDGP